MGQRGKWIGEGSTAFTRATILTPILLPLPPPLHVLDFHLLNGGVSIVVEAFTMVGKQTFTYRRRPSQSHVRAPSCGPTNAPLVWLHWQGGIWLGVSCHKLTTLWKQLVCWLGAEFASTAYISSTGSGPVLMTQVKWHWTSGCESAC